MADISFPVCETIPGLQLAVKIARAEGKRIGCVPTMGALHEGHLSLIDECRRHCDFVVVTIFVNPTQFGPGEDLDKYPRTFDRDCELSVGRGADVIFFPSNEEIYPPGSDTFVEVSRLTTQWEGAIRPGHFNGVTTIVAKLFNIVQPDVACFGQKDFQQQAVIRRMVIDLNFPIEIVICPTVREPDGLAMSSRNRYLTSEQRDQSLALFRSLELAKRMIVEGTPPLPQIREEMASTMRIAGIDVDYATIAQPDSLEELAERQSSMVALVAGRLGGTRLIDNMLVTTDNIAESRE